MLSMVDTESRGCQDGMHCGASRIVWSAKGAMMWQHMHSRLRRAAAAAGTAFQVLPSCLKQHVLLL